MTPPGSPRQEDAAAAVGTFCLVLHSHLPWVAHHGRWPVGEEWLYQAWTSSYLPLTRLLGRLADEGRRDVLTLGVTPVLAEQLDDVYCLDGVAAWVQDWQQRAQQLGSGAGPDQVRSEVAERERSAARLAQEDLQGPWSRGGSPVLRRLADRGVLELMAGPATHPVLPLLDARTARLAVRVGLEDHRFRYGRRPASLWLPECGWAPELLPLVRDNGIAATVLDGPTLAGADRDIARAWRLAGTDVALFGRDAELCNLVWSDQDGYQTGPDYRDFHRVDASGFRLTRIGDDANASPYRPGDAAAAAERDAKHFVDAVHERLARSCSPYGHPAVVVAAFDTELFGHWWAEGLTFLEHVLRLLPQAGVRTRSLAGALADGAVQDGGRADPPAGSWGGGHDFRVWTGQGVRSVIEDAGGVRRRLFDLVDAEREAGRLRERRPDLDQMAREVLLHGASDWTYMLNTGQAPDYAGRRVDEHRDAVHRIADAFTGGGSPAARRSARLVREADDVFPHLDVRALV